jgi:hypothetical protein
MHIFIYISFKPWFLSYVLIVCCSFIFATLDSNVGEVEGEEVCEGFEEDQGLSNQGKPSFDLFMLCYMLFLSSCDHRLLVHLELTPLMLTLCMLTLSMYDPLTPQLSSP